MACTHVLIPFYIFIYIKENHVEQCMSGVSRNEEVNAKITRTPKMCCKIGGLSILAF